MEDYAYYFSLNPIFRPSIEEAEFDPVTGFWRVRTDDSNEYFSRWLTVATGENAEPAVPEIAGIERFKGPVLHTSVYKSGSEFPKHSATPHVLVRNYVHMLPRDMFGVSTFAIAMFLLKWLPLKRVVMLLLLMASFILRNTDRLGIRRPKTSPMELKNVTGKSPVKGTDFFTEDGIPKTPFPNGWKGENGLYAVGFSRRDLLGSSSDAMNIARDISDEWWMMNKIFPAKEIQILK